MTEPHPSGPRDVRLIVTVIALLGALLSGCTSSSSRSAAADTTTTDTVAPSSSTLEDTTTTSAEQTSTSAPPTTAHDPDPLIDMAAEPDSVSIKAGSTASFVIWIDCLNRGVGAYNLVPGNFSPLPLSGAGEYTVAFDDGSSLPYDTSQLGIYRAVLTPAIGQVWSTGKYVLLIALKDGPGHGAVLTSFEVTP